MSAAKRFVGYTTRGGLLREPERTKAGNIRIEYVCHCEECGTVFFSKRPHAKYHSNACRQKAYRKRKKFNLRAQAMKTSLSQMRLAI